MLGDNKRSAKKDDSGEYIKDDNVIDGEYPQVLYKDEHVKYPYFLGNFDIKLIYEQIINDKSTKFEIYPFGNSWAEYCNILIDKKAYGGENPSIKNEKESNKLHYIGSLYMLDSMDEFQTLYYNTLRYINKSGAEAVEYVKKICPQSHYSFDVEGSEFRFVPSGGNCGTIKFKMV